MPVQDRGRGRRILVVLLVLGGLLAWGSSSHHTSRMAIANTTGTQIAFVTTDGSGNATGIDRMNPDGTNRQDIWDYPGGSGDIADVQWNPAANELAFASDHEAAYSPYTTNIFGIRPDGSSLRRITFPPARSTIIGGGFPTGTVQVNLFNNTHAFFAPTTFVMYVQGAPDAQNVTLPPFQTTSQVTFNNVAELGGLQDIVITWSGGDCNLSKFVNPTGVDVQPGGTATINVDFDGTVCNTVTTSANNVLALTWQRDGSTIGYNLSGAPGIVTAASGQVGAWFTAPGFINAPAFSPTNDDILYDVFSGNSSTDGIYRKTAGSPANDPGTRILTENASDIVWLPDGSGFLFINTGQIAFFDFGSDTGGFLSLPGLSGGTVSHISVAPDTTNLIIAFSYRQGTTENIYTVDYTDPSNPIVNQLTNDGQSTNPSWSSTTPSTPTPTPSPTPSPTTSPTPSPTPTPTTSPTPSPTPSPSPAPGSQFVYLPMVVKP